MATIVTAGIYRGFTLSEMEEELTRYKEAVKSAGSDIASVSVGGDSYTYGPRRDMNLDQWGERIAEAFAILGDTRFGTPTGNMGAFRIL